MESSFFAAVTEEAEDYAADVRKRTLAIEDPPVEEIFQHVYSENHPVMAEELAWLKTYNASFEAGA